MKKLLLLFLCFVFLSGLTTEDKRMFKAWKKSTKIAEKICKAKGEYSSTNRVCFCNEFLILMDQKLDNNWGEWERGCIGNPLSIKNIKNNPSQKPNYAYKQTGNQQGGGKLYDDNQNNQQQNQGWSDPGSFPKSGYQK